MEVVKPAFSKPTQHFLLFVALLIGMGFLGHILSIDLKQIKETLVQYPLWISGAVFVFIYVALTMLLWVGTIDLFRISGALLFGPYWSTLFVFLAEIFNAAMLFIFSRKLGREFIEKKFNLKKNDKYSPDDAGFWTAFILRINPLVPFRLMDVGFGLTKLSFRKYFYAVVLGSPLRIFWQQFLIAGMGEAVLKDFPAMIRYFQTNRPALILNGVYLGSVIIITAAVFIATIVKRNALVRQLSDLKRPSPSSP